jgi:hypothetical protein
MGRLDYRLSDDRAFRAGSLCSDYRDGQSWWFVAFRIRERLREFGMRVALGGARRAILLSTLAAEMLWPLVGGVIGVVGAVAVARLAIIRLWRCATRCREPGRRTRGFGDGRRHRCAFSDLAGDAH